MKFGARERTIQPKVHQPLKLHDIRRSWFKRVRPYMKWEWRKGSIDNTISIEAQRRFKSGPSTTLPARGISVPNMLKQPAQLSTLLFLRTT
jgi:hypothetical protein